MLVFRAPLSKGHGALLCPFVLSTNIHRFRPSSLKASSIILHEDLAKMSVREQKLEEALAEAQSSISTEPHPLLVRDSQIRMASPVPGLQRPLKVGTTDTPHQAPDAGAEELVAALGMMSIGDKQQYHGDTATSEVRDTLRQISSVFNAHSLISVSHPGISYEYLSLVAVFSSLFLHRTMSMTMAKRLSPTFQQSVGHPHQSTCLLNFFFLPSNSPFHLLINAYPWIHSCNSCRLTKELTSLSPCTIHTTLGGTSMLMFSTPGDSFRHQHYARTEHRDNRKLVLPLLPERHASYLFAPLRCSSSSTPIYDLPFGHAL